MNLPGFSAEASAYKTAGKYWAVATGSSFGSKVSPMGGRCGALCCEYCEQCEGCKLYGDCPSGGVAICNLCTECQEAGKCSCNPCTCTTKKCCDGSCSTSHPVQC
jgi:hypothetical protein